MLDFDDTPSDFGFSPALGSDWMAGGGAAVMTDPSMVMGETWQMADAYDSPDWDYGPSIPAEWLVASEAARGSVGVVGGVDPSMGQLEYGEPAPAGRSKGACCGSCAGSGGCDGGGGVGGAGCSCTAPRFAKGWPAPQVSRSGATAGECDAEFEQHPYCCDLDGETQAHGVGPETATVGDDWTSEQIEMCEACGGTWDDEECPPEELKPECCCCPESLCMEVMPQTKSAFPLRAIPTIRILGAGRGLAGRCDLSWDEAVMDGWITNPDYDRKPMRSGRWNHGFPNSQTGRMIWRQLNMDYGLACLLNRRDGHVARQLAKPLPTDDIGKRDKDLWIFVRILSM